MDLEVDPEADPESTSLSLSDPPVFAFFAVVCIIAGLVLGGMCAWMFYQVSHPSISIIPGAHAVGVQIPQWAGIVFILIMATTGMMIALTFAFVPRWVMKYYAEREMPPFVSKVIGWINEIRDKMSGEIGK